MKIKKAYRIFFFNIHGWVDCGRWQTGGGSALAKSFLEKNSLFFDFYFFIFFSPWEVYEIILQNSAVPKAARRASEMVWGSRSKGLSQDFQGGFLGSPTPFFIVPGP